MCSPISTASRPLSRTIVASARFIAGEPMKPPTKRFTGRSYSSCGGATCCSSPLAHDRDAVAHRHRLDLVVRDVDRRDAELVLQARDLGAHVHAQLGVEVRERLVHEVGLGLAHDRATHGHPLALTAGERAGLALEELGEPEDVGRLADALVDLRLRRLPQPEAEGDVVVDGEVRVERVALEDHGDVAVARGHVIDDALADSKHALADALEPGHHAERGRLAAARRADEHHELAVADLEIHPRHGARPVGIDLADSVKGHGCHQCRLCLPVDLLG